TLKSASQKLDDKHEIDISLKKSFIFVSFSTGKPSQSLKVTEL
ncbi:20356_t:CDS:1, partial [Rhizophagus irregularis]